MSNKTYSSRLIKNFVCIFAIILISSLLTSCKDLGDYMKEAFDAGLVIGIILGGLFFFGHLYDSLKDNIKKK